MPLYNVTLPMAGHAFVQVEADNEEAAITAAMDQVEMKDIEEWEVLSRVTSGNVCHFPTPWEPQAELD